jgi:hypothetical protein
VSRRGQETGAERGQETGAERGQETGAERGQETGAGRWEWISHAAGLRSCVATMIDTTE